MKTQSTVRPEQFTINDLGKKKEIKLCENIVEIVNEDGETLYEYDMELQTISKDTNLIGALIHLKYSYDDELALLNKGLLDSQDIEYVAYRDYVLQVKAYKLNEGA